MKKLTSIWLIAVMIMLSGCSFLNEVNDSIDYANTAIEHINTLNSYADELPQLIEEAQNNPELMNDIEAQLTSLKGEIEQFIALKDIPQIAKDIHQELIVLNEGILNEINLLLVNGNLVLDQIESSEIFTTINDASDLINRIENLTQ